MPTNEADHGPGVRADDGALQRGWLRVGVGVAVAAQAMVFSLAVNITPAEGAAYVLVHAGLAVSALAVLVFLGRDLLAEAWAALAARRVTIDLLFLVTLLGALAGSVTSSVTGTGSVYYEVVAVLVVVHTLGKMAGARSRAAALRAADAAAEKFERCMVRRADGSEAMTPVAELRGGERVVVAPGGAIAVDGLVVEGRSYVEEAAMTGEWRPVARSAGDAVWAGTYAVDGRLVVEVRAAAGRRRLDEVLRAVAEARLAPSRLQEQADRLMRWFLPVVTGASALTFVGWMAGGAEWQRALFNAMAVLLVACPCAMGLATPVAVWGGLARLARGGIVARSGDFLEVLARVDTVCLDKTGTLSEERLEVIRWEFFGEWRDRENELRAIVAELERGVAHPVARALTRLETAPEQCNQFGYTFPELAVVAGRGVQARAEKGGAGRWVRVGEAEFCGLADARETADAGGVKSVWVAVDGAPAARVRLAEAWRPGVVEAVAELERLGLAVEILSGDPQAESGKCNQFGYTVPVRGGLSAADKARRVGELTGEGRVVLLAGDGVNDAAAMSVAAGSLALRGGSELARAAAMAVCAGDDLRRLPEAVKLARRVVAGIRGNVRFAASYNLVGMALAAAGVLHPVVAALLMVGSSTWVGVRAMRSAEDKLGDLPPSPGSNREFRV